ncbi:MAG: hypothetical protein HY784_07745, partial [Chloroflexi bacterium]|nr:hypothetical protein [Chloroflexota bacterium]
MKFEEKYEDVLQNLEFAIAGVYREHPDMLDADALSGVEWLIRLYNAEAKGRASALAPPAGLAGEVVRAARAMCDWRPGRTAAETESGQAFQLPMKTLPEILL